ncbi:glutamine synthetase family protein [Roseovarius pelagicus]|uniref:Glutamine synthetase family protein n=1 Tax=Roseovarius pelagicus TaxID=2980108 RepID=A0ABY6DDY6_9RHOB|nr:glutamine synthetase family protein [Roseovarius pelagicus]UXX84054.1 glutamine synthetase family protein [Roseovarius pelagicus]
MQLENFATFRVAACDLNGQMRGKRVPASYFEKLESGTVRMPLSALNVDIKGADIDGSPLIFETGDADGILLPTSRGAVPLPWLDGSQPLVPMQMYFEDGTPFYGDARHALRSVLDRYQERGWQVIASTELEFTLVDDSGKVLKSVRDPRSGRRIDGSEILSLSEMDAFDPFLSALYESCAAMDIDAQTATSEAGVGQFEITLNHQQALHAADDTWLFKALIRGLARKFGCAATFMAKPFVQDSGNGMHMHFSVLDADGNNIFDDGGPKGTDMLRAAIGGCVAAMRGSTLVFAPHANSYARLVPDAHAPTAICWAYENRTAAVRVPGGSPAARRIEHRVAGGDINPYLSFAAILGAALIGIEDDMDPGTPISGNAYGQDLPQLAEDWRTAVDLFESDPLIARIFEPKMVRNLVLTKRQEIEIMFELPEDQHWKTYLEKV